MPDNGPGENAVMGHERYCKHCGYWYPADDWTEDEHHVKQGGFGKTIATLRTVECPGCGSTHDALGPPLREVRDDAR